MNFTYTTAKSTWKSTGRIDLTRACAYNVFIPSYDGSLGQVYRDDYRASNVWWHNQDPTTRYQTRDRAAAALMNTNPTIQKQHEEGVIADLIDLHTELRKT